jgi:ribosomal protein S18 acetylase RimI-like enzyme
MQTCIDEAARAGHDALWLKVWVINERAIAFYGRWGFAELGTVAVEAVGEPKLDLVMCCPIPAPTGPS